MRIARRAGREWQGHVGTTRAGLSRLFRGRPDTCRESSRDAARRGATRIGRNSFSFWEGARTGHGPTNHVDAVIRFGAGGKFSILGDYLVRDQVSPGLDNGLWGLLRVE